MACLCKGYQSESELTNLGLACTARVGVTRRILGTDTAGVRATDLMPKLPKKVEELSMKEAILLYCFLSCA